MFDQREAREAGVIEHVSWAQLVIWIEVQCGDYVGEDDIVRFDDKYGRVKA